MFDRYTDRARRVVVLAQEEARMLNHREVDAHHLLAALAVEGDGVAARALARAGLDVPAIRDAVETVTPRWVTPVPGLLAFTSRVKKAMELALRESLRLRHNFIGTEHLLLGLIRECGEEESPVTAVLELTGVRLASIGDAVEELLHGYQRAQAGTRALTGFPAELASLLSRAADDDLALALGAIGGDQRERLRKALEAAG